MKIKGYYLLQDSFQQLLRTKGVGGTLILSSLIATISFFCFYLFLFFHHIHQGMLTTLEQETDPMSIQIGLGPILGMLLFKLGVCLMSLILFLLTIFYIKKSFQQMMLIQGENLKIRFLIGESQTYIKWFYVCQIELFTLFSLLIGFLVGSQIFKQAIIKTIQIGIDSESVNHFKGNPFYISLIFITLLLFMLSSSIFSFSKKLKGMLI